MRRREGLLPDGLTEKGLREVTVAVAPIAWRGGGLPAVRSRWSP
jgi:hypothetical protein